MKQLLAGILLAPSLLFAQPVTLNKPVTCVGSKELLDAIMNSNQPEKPVWTGRDEISRYALFLDEKTGSWTLIQFDDKTGCIIGFGDKSMLIQPKKSGLKNTGS